MKPIIIASFLNTTDDIIKEENNLMNQNEEFEYCFKENI